MNQHYYFALFRPKNVLKTNKKRLFLASFCAAGTSLGASVPTASILFYECYDVPLKVYPFLKFLNLNFRLIRVIGH